MSEPSVWTRWDETLLIWGHMDRPERLELRPKDFPDPPSGTRPSLWEPHLNRLKFEE